MATTAPEKTAKKKEPPVVDPTSDESLLALDLKFAEAPDMPVSVAKEEWGSLARMAKSKAADFERIGLGEGQIEIMARYARRIDLLEKNWQKARAGVNLSARERKQLEEAEKLDGKLVAGGRWGCRNDPDALEELARIAEGSGLRDTVSDLKDLVGFWAEHPAEREHTDVTDKDLARATELAVALEPAAQKEESNLGAAGALELRNRCFWAGDKLAKELREGGRYAFSSQLKIARKFVSRYRAAAVRRAKRKAKVAKSTGAPPKPTGQDD